MCANTSGEPTSTRKRHHRQSNHLALHQAHGYDGPPTLLGWARHLRQHWHDNYAPKSNDEVFPNLPPLPTLTWRQRVNKFAWLYQTWSPAWSWQRVYVEDRRAGFTRKQAFLAWLEFGFRPYWRCLRHGR